MTQRQPGHESVTASPSRANYGIMQHSDTKPGGTMHARTTAALILAGVLLVGCGNSTDDAKPAASRATETTTAAAKPTPTITPDAGPTTLDMGYSWAWENSDQTTGGTTTVIAYKQHVATDATTPEEDAGAEAKGYVWASLEIKTCSDDTSTASITVGNGDWKLAYDDGALIESSSTTYDQFPRPEYPIETQLAPGRCVRGKIVYAVPGDQRPTQATFVTAGGEQPAEWTVPAK